MRVLLALQQLGGDGVSRFSLDLGAQLQALGAQVKLFVYRAADGGEVPHGGAEIPVVRGQPPAMRQRYWAPILTSRLMSAVLAADVVLGGQEGGEGVAAAYIASVLTRTPVAIAVQCNVTESLANAGGWTMPVLRHAYPRFDRLFCASSGVAETAVVAMNAPRERLRVIRNGTDVARVQRLAAEPPPSWLPDRPFVVSVGRLAPQKGYDLLIRAYAQAREQGLSDALVILGEGDERPALERLVAELGLGDHVHLPGYQANPFPVVRRASTYCMSSRFEGYGLVLAEALALGLPVISTDCVSGPREVLADGEFGLLVEPGSVEALAQALVENGRHPERLRAKAEQATAHVDRFSVEGTAHAYMEQLGQLVR